MTNNLKTGIYVHIPFCRSRCDYCGFISCTDFPSIENYVDSLIREADERVSGEADTVYIGGGTPSVLPRGCLNRIFSAIRKRAELSADCEITTEANPDSCDDEFLSEARECGVNRLSIGVQSLSDDLLLRIGRRHNREQAISAIGRARKHGFDNISCDLMLSLPGQSVADATDSADRLCDSGITHISVYALGVEPGTVMYDSGYRPNEDLSADMYDAVYGRLVIHGFERYEVSNFCRDGKFSRHNMKYWMRAPYIGLGAAAHSFVNNVRSYNTSDIQSYIAGENRRVNERLRTQDALEEYVMLGLRISRGIKYAELDGICGYDWKASKMPIITELASGGFIEETEDGLKLSDRAYYVMNEVILKLI